MIHSATERNQYREIPRDTVGYRGVLRGTNSAKRHDAIPRDTERYREKPIPRDAERNREVPRETDTETY